MSRLSVYWPEECLTASTAVADEPRILPFPKSRFGSVWSTPEQPTRSKASRLDVVSRARLLFANRQCRSCGHPLVEPLELDDAQVNRQGLEIPGTATIVGFHCRSCDTEWSS